jgi:endonuclease III
MSNTKAFLSVAEALKVRYSDFDHHNKSNPLDELLFIICSIKTTASGYSSTYLALKRRFPRHEQIAEAPAEYIAMPIKRGGLANNKAKSIRRILDVLMDRFGRPTLSPLKSWSDRECEAFLTSLPGVGKKVARCVMMYSLGRKVFPMDTHCWRITRRLGWVRPTSKNGRPSPRDMDRLQAKIPPDLRFSLHVNMVSLGREYCRARNPNCPECPIADYCRKIGANRSV